MAEHRIPPPNRLVRALDKPTQDFTKRDLVRFIAEHGVRVLNFRFVGGDGRLKKLNFVIQGARHLDRVLTAGERVDGSSLFSFVAADSSDLYVVPRYRTAFVNPFAEVPTLDILCSFYDDRGEPLESAPEQVARKAQRALRERTGYTLEALGELEYYLFSDADRIYPILEQRGYHESHPFSKWGLVRREAMLLIAEMGGTIKYGHAEVGNILSGKRAMVQHEIEFLPAPIEDAADQLVTAKWALREVAYKHGLEVSFAPKISVGQAGSGLHVHTRLAREGADPMTDERGLTEPARRLIAGFLSSAESLTAFGNTVPTSYLRLVPHQEAPTRVCWGDRNRSVLVRVPLGWRGVGSRMVRDANPAEPEGEISPVEHAQTVELRSPDGSANVHLLLAGMAVAARHGLEAADALRVCEEGYVRADATKAAGLRELPASCVASGARLLADRARYEAHGVFPAGLVEAQAAMLRGHDDDGLGARLQSEPAALEALVRRHLHCG